MIQAPRLYPDGLILLGTWGLGPLLFERLVQDVLGDDCVTHQNLPERLSRKSRAQVLLQNRRKFAQHGGDLYVCIASRFLDVSQQELDYVNRLQDRIDDRSLDGHFTLTHLVQNAFRMMGHLDKPRETQKPC